MQDSWRLVNRCYRYGTGQSRQGFQGLVQLAHRGLAEVATSRVTSLGGSTRVDRSQRDYAQISNNAALKFSETPLQPLRKPYETALFIPLNEFS